MINKWCLIAFLLISNSSQANIELIHRTEHEDIYRLNDGVQIEKLVNGQIITDHIILVERDRSPVISILVNGASKTLKLNTITESGLPYIETKKVMSDGQATICGTLNNTTLSAHWEVRVGNHTYPTNCVSLEQIEETTDMKFTATLYDDQTIVRTYQHKVSEKPAPERFHCAIRLKDDGRSLRPYCQSEVETIERVYFTSADFPEHELIKWPIDLDLSNVRLIVRSSTTSQTFELEQLGEKYDLVPIN